MTLRENNVIKSSYRINSLTKNICLFATLYLVFLSPIFSLSSMGEINRSLENAKVPFFYLFKVDKSNLIHLNSNKYLLITPIRNIKSIAVFSDRPERIFLSTSKENIIDFLYLGNKSIGAHFVSVSLSIDDKSNGMLSFYLISINKTKNSIVYYLKLSSVPEYPGNYEGRINLFLFK